MKVLVGCERSGIIRDAFTAQGWDAVSCDLAPSERPGRHIQDSLLHVLSSYAQGQIEWDLFIVHPPCQYLCGSGMHWTTRGFRDPQLTLDAIAFAEAVWNADIPYICLENPTGVLSTRANLGVKPQYIQPYEFGEDASKNTGLWLKGLPRLVSTQYIEPRLVEYKGKIVKRWANQTDSGQNRLGPSEERSAIRAQTYPGIANAMAAQWSAFLAQPYGLSLFAGVK